MLCYIYENRNKNQLGWKYQLLWMNPGKFESLGFLRNPNVANRFPIIIGREDGRLVYNFWDIQNRFYKIIEFNNYD